MYVDKNAHGNECINPLHANHRPDTPGINGMDWSQLVERVALLTYAIQCTDRRSDTGESLCYLWRNWIKVNRQEV